MFRICLCLLICFPLWAVAQEKPEQCKWLKTANSWQVLDSLSVYPPSISLGATDSVAAVEYNINTGQIRFSEGEWPDSVKICYRTLPYALHQTYQKRSLNIYDSSALFEYPSREKAPKYLKEELFATDSLQKSGSISRGISFGNRQNVFVQSTLNLQLDGKLSDNVNIRAAISDQNVPFQPEGNTQNLQEFDKVFIQLYNDKNALTAGDLVLQRQDSYFLKYLKNVQGLSFKTQYPLLGTGNSETEVGLALAKGKFASVNLTPVEGLSGPYKLPGPGNQQFVMVLSNSEKVYLDGRLLNRGFNYDYVIDYNLGEISFNPGIIITQYSRIRIDYEYSDQSYTRSIVNASHQQEMGKWKFYSHFYQEKDNRNQPLAINLTDFQKEQLSLAGDRQEGVFVEAVDSVGYHEDLLLYRKATYTDPEGGIQVYYEFSNNPEEAFYQLSFADVGQGNGDYKVKEYIGKGKVYEFVAPVNGQKQGRFEPVRLLIPATLQNMLSSGISYKIDGYQELSTEVALSKNDQNLFSELDRADDKGVGVKIDYQLKGMPVGFMPKYKWEGGLDYEYVQRSFNPVDRFRTIEYDRDWGLAPGSGFIHSDAFEDAYDDHILTLRGGMQKDQANGFLYKIAGRQKGQLVNGWQQEASAAKRLGILQLEGSHFLLRNQQAVQDIRWHRWQSSAALHFEKWISGYRYTADRQATYLPAQDSLLSTLMNFREHSLFLQSGVANKSNFRLEYSKREDQLPLEGRFEKANLAHTTSFSYANAEGKNQRFRSLISYRHSTNFQDTSRAGNLEKTLSGQVNWLGNFFRKGLKSELIYTVGSGRELRRDYVYVRVPAGEGTHTWRDGNGNGIQELGEFYEAINPDERQFLRIFVPNMDFILAYTSELNYRLSFREVMAWAELTGVKKVLSRFSGNASWRVSKKVTADGISERFVPFSGGVEDSELLNTRQSLQLNLFYKKSDPRWGLDGTLLTQQRKQLLTAGFETDQRRQYILGCRYNIGRSWGFKLRGIGGSQANLSDFLLHQQFHILSREIAPEVSWMPGVDLQITAGASVEQKDNALNTELAEWANLSDVNLNVRYSRLGNTAVTSTIRQVYIEFKGQENSPAAYSMLEALRPGTNWIWNLNLQQKLLNGLQLTVSYEGRQSEGHYFTET